MFDQASLANTEVEFEVAGGGVTGTLQIGDAYYPLEAVVGVYNRLVDWGSAGSLAAFEGRSDLQIGCISAAYAALCAYRLEVSAARIVNRPGVMGSNFSKPYQLQLIRRRGQFLEILLPMIPISFATSGAGMGA